MTRPGDGGLTGREIGDSLSRAMTSSRFRYTCRERIVDELHHNGTRQSGSVKLVAGVYERKALNAMNS
jgi:hypothetical protein